MGCNSGLYVPLMLATLICLVKVIIFNSFHGLLHVYSASNLVLLFESCIGSLLSEIMQTKIRKRKWTC